MKEIKWKLLNRIARLLGYKNIFSELNGIVMVVGNKYDDKGWNTFSIQFNKKSGKDKYFKGKISNIYIVKNKVLSKKEIKRQF